MTEQPALPSRLSELTVIIAGGGIGGLAAALLLSRAGAAGVTLVERVADPAEVGAGLLLQPNGLAVLKGLELDGTLKSSGFAADGGSVHGADGRVISRIATPDYGTGLDHVVAIRRSMLYSAMLTAVRSDPAIHCLFGSTVVGASPTGRVTIRNGDETRELSGGLVVGADGISSTIRAAGDFGATLSATGHSYLRAIVPDAGASTMPLVGPDEGGPPFNTGGSTELTGDAGARLVNALPDLAGEYWTPLGLFGGTRIDEGHLYFYADVTSGPVAEAVRHRDLPALTSIWAHEFPMAGQLLRRVASFDELLINDVKTVTCRRWFDSRLVLIGDAAHSMPPNAGQGANCALVDAAILAFHLGRYPLQQALTTYDKRRRHPVRKVQRRAAQLARLAGIRNAFLQELRDSTLRVLGAVPGSGQRLAKGLQQENPAQLVAIVRDTIGAGRD
ncbi:MAG: NAD(P)/FAD-dependent oxidoreductase [Nakamurella sp.]